MADFPDIATIAKKEIVTSDHMNDLKDAIDIIRDKARYYYLRGAADPDLTTSSSSFADLGASFTVASLVLSTNPDGNANPVHIRLYSGRQTTAAATVQFDVLIDGVSVRGGTAVWIAGTNTPVNLEWVADGLLGGTHSFKIQWKSASAALSTLFSANGIWYEIVEE